MGRVVRLYKNIIFISVIGLLVSFTFLFSCRSSKKLAKPSLETYNQYKEKYDFITDNAFDFDWFSSKISLKSGGLSANGQIRMQKDSVIWLSLSVFIEVARIKITPDSVFFYNKLQSEYYAGDYTFLEKNFLLKVDFATLQSIFVGNDLPMYGKPRYISYPDTENSSEVTYQFIDRIISEDQITKTERQMLNVGFSDGKIHSGTTLSQGFELSTRYANFISTEKGLFPTNHVYLLKDYATNQMIELELKFDTPVLDKPLTFPFSVSENAKPISF